MEKIIEEMKGYQTDLIQKNQKEQFEKKKAEMMVEEKDRHFSIISF